MTAKKTHDLTAGDILVSTSYIDHDAAVLVEAHDYLLVTKATATMVHLVECDRFGCPEDREAFPRKVDTRPGAPTVRGREYWSGTYQPVGGPKRDAA